MSFGQLFDTVNKLPSPWNTIVLWVVVLALIGVTLIKTIKIVPQGHLAMRTRFGRVVFKDGKPVYLKPGMHILFPFVHNLVRVSVLDRSIALSPMRLRYGSFDVTDVNATVTFAVVDIFRMTYAVDDFTGRLTAACESRLRQVLRGVSPGLLDGTVAVIIATFQEAIEPIAAELGVGLKALDVTNVAPDAQFAIAGAIQHLGTNGSAVLDTLGVDPKSKTP